ncbi:PTS sugar transporter subunit IIB, partial [Streptococcus mutans]|uniref:PTS sugar transporter subunit IIB n=1 Tax=Streptococcus mutans TaxID=1309 RepID=UPI001455B0A9
KKKVNHCNSTLTPTRFTIIHALVSHPPAITYSMRMAKPSGKSMSIIDTQKAIANFKNGNYDKQDVFIIVKEPSTLLKLLDNGISIPRVNLGIVFADDVRTNISKFVNLNQSEVNELKKIEERGIPIIIQYIPDDSVIVFEKAIENKKFK